MVSIVIPISTGGEFSVSIVSNVIPINTGGEFSVSISNNVIPINTEGGFQITEIQFNYSQSCTWFGIK